MLKEAVAIAAVLLVARTAAGADNLISVNKVRIVIGGDTYVWKERSEVPAKVPGALVDPDTVISFLSFAPGDRVTPESLEAKARRAESRLVSSTYFYNATCLIVPPRENPQMRTVLVTVTEGFRYRFGGGNAYGMFGMDDIAGRRASFRLFGGYNLVGGYLRHEQLWRRPIVMGLAAMYRSSALTGSPLGDYRSFEATATAGYRLHPDWLLAVDSTALHARHTRVADPFVPGFVGSPSQSTFILSPRLLYAFRTDLNPIASGTQALFQANLHLPDGGGAAQVSWLVRLAGKYRFWPKHSLNLQLAAGGASGPLPLLQRFDLYSTPDFAIRAGRPPEALVAENIALCNAEYRLSFARFFVAPFFNVQIDGFLYSDLGLAAASGQSIRSGPLQDAYGGGLRLNFDSPVFAYFSFSYGTDRFGNPRFVFTGTSGF
jgi:hypothetical protein